MATSHACSTNKCDNVGDPLASALDSLLRRTCAAKLAADATTQPQGIESVVAQAGSGDVEEVSPVGKRWSSLPGRLLADGEHRLGVFCGEEADPAADVTAQPTGIESAAAEAGSGDVEEVSPVGKRLSSVHGRISAHGEHRCGVSKGEEASPAIENETPHVSVGAGDSDKFADNEIVADDTLLFDGQGAKDHVANVATLETLMEEGKDMEEGLEEEADKETVADDILLFDIQDTKDHVANVAPPASLRRNVEEDGEEREEVLEQEADKETVAEENLLFDIQDTRDHVANVAPSATHSRNVEEDREKREEVLEQEADKETVADDILLFDIQGTKDHVANVVPPATFSRHVEEGGEEREDVLEQEADKETVAEDSLLFDIHDTRDHVAKVAPSATLSRHVDEGGDEREEGLDEEADNETVADDILLFDIQGIKDHVANVVPHDASFCRSAEEEGLEEATDNETAADDILLFDVQGTKDIAPPALSRSAKEEEVEEREEGLEVDETEEREEGKEVDEGKASVSCRADGANTDIVEDHLVSTSTPSAQEVAKSCLVPPTAGKPVTPHLRRVLWLKWLRVLQGQQLSDWIVEVRSHRVEFPELLRSAQLRAEHDASMKQTVADVERDVARCRPSVDCLQTPEVRAALKDVLLAYVEEHSRPRGSSEVYRQGMHELAAAMLLICRQGSWTALQSEEAKSMCETESSRYAELLDSHEASADAWALLNALLHDSRLIDMYETSAAAGEEPALACRCLALVSDLRYLNPSIAASMKAWNLAPHIFLLRWMRLLFLDEFTHIDDALIIWDAIFADAFLARGHLTASGHAVSSDDVPYSSSEVMPFVDALALAMILHVQPVSPEQLLRFSEQQPPPDIASLLRTARDLSSRFSHGSSLAEYQRAMATSSSCYENGGSLETSIQMPPPLLLRCPADQSAVEDLQGGHPHRGSVMKQQLEHNRQQQQQQQQVQQQVPLQQWFFNPRGQVPEERCEADEFPVPLKQWSPRKADMFPQPPPAAYPLTRDKFLVPNDLQHRPRRPGREKVRETVGESLGAGNWGRVFSMTASAVGDTVNSILGVVSDGGYGGEPVHGCFGPVDSARRHHGATAEAVAEEAAAAEKGHRRPREWHSERHTYADKAPSHATQVRREFERRQDNMEEFPHRTLRGESHAVSENVTPIRTSMSGKKKRLPKESIRAAALRGPASETSSATYVPESSRKEKVDGSVVGEAFGSSTSSFATSLDRPSVVRQGENQAVFPARVHRREVVEMFKPAPKARFSAPVDISGAQMASPESPPPMVRDDPAAFLHPGAYAGAVDIKAWEASQRYRNYQPVL